MSWTKHQIMLMQEGYTEEQARSIVKSERERVEQLEYTKSKNYGTSRNKRTKTVDKLSKEPKRDS